MWVLNWLLIRTNGRILWVRLGTVALYSRKSLERNNFHKPQNRGVLSYRSLANEINALRANRMSAWINWHSWCRDSQPAAMTFLSGPFPASKLLKRFRKSLLSQTACHLFATDGPNYWIQRHYGSLLARYNEWITHFNWSRITQILQCVRWEGINHGRPTFFYDTGPHPLMWVGSWSARGKLIK